MYPGGTGNDTTGPHRNHTRVFQDLLLDKVDFYGYS
jgi:hypothetical protein